MMYSVQKGCVTERDEGIERTGREVGRNEVKLLMKSPMKVEKHSRIIC